MFTVIGRTLWSGLSWLVLTWAAIGCFASLVSPNLTLIPMIIVMSLMMKDDWNGKNPGATAAFVAVTAGVSLATISLDIRSLPVGLFYIFLIRPFEWATGEMTLDEISELMIGESGVVTENALAIGLVAMLCWGLSIFIAIRSPRT